MPAQTLLTFVNIKYRIKIGKMIPIEKRIRNAE